MKDRIVSVAGDCAPWYMITSAICPESETTIFGYWLQRAESPSNVLLRSKTHNQEVSVLRCNVLYILLPDKFKQSTGQPTERTCVVTEDALKRCELLYVEFMRPKETLAPELVAKCLQTGTRPAGESYFFHLVGWHFSL